MNRYILAAAFAVATTPAFAVSPGTTGCYASANTTDTIAFPVGYTLDQGLASYGVKCEAPSGGGGARWDTTAFVGLSVSFGTGDKSPNGGVHLTAGVRRTNVNADGRVYGGEGHASINLAKLQDIQVRALGLYGNRSALGNGGIGLDFGKSQPVVSAAAQIPFARILVDFHSFDKDLRVFLEGNTYSKIRKSSSGGACNLGAKKVDENGAASIVNTAAPTSYPIFTGGFLTGSFAPNTDFNVYKPVNGIASSNWVSGQTCFSIGAPPS